MNQFINPLKVGVNSILTQWNFAPKGTQNHSGMGVFSVTPVEGSISPEQSEDVVISFQPDHPSVNYRDRLSIKLMNQVRNRTHNGVAPTS